MSEELANRFEQSPYITEPTRLLHAAPAISVTVKVEPRPIGAGSFRFRPAPDRRKVAMPMRPYAERRAARR